MRSAKFDNPFEAVFLKPFGKRNEPLFKTQVKLAEAIIENPDSRFDDKRPETLRSAISQIFTGERNLSKSLRFALFSTIKKRFDDKKYNYPAFEKELIEKFNSLYESRISEKREKIGDRDYSSLIEATRSGAEFLITTLEPAELHQSELADRLKNQLLEKTGILNDTDDEIIPATYKFFLPEENAGRVARKFWIYLKEFIMDEHKLSSEETNKKLLKANKEGKILTFLASMDIALHPYVFINYTSHNKRVGYCVSYRNKNIPSVAELSFEVIDEWFKHYERRINDIESQSDDKGNKINCYYFEP